LGLLWAFIDHNVAVFSQKMQLEKGKTKAETIGTIATSFIGSPYVPHTLERVPESLVINLREFDCFTFVESVLALVESRHGRKVFTEYANFLQQMRFRNGDIKGYGSRIHYFLEWKWQATQRGFLIDITEQLGGVKTQPKINFMTTHRNLYAGLSDSLAYDEVQTAEQRLSQKPWYFIPKEKVAEIEAKLQNGDLVAFTSNIAGLDFNHEGFVIKKDNRAYLLHASSDYKKAMITTEPLADYAQKIKKHSGIVVLRSKP